MWSMWKLKTDTREITKETIIEFLDWIQKDRNAVTLREIHA